MGKKFYYEDEHGGIYFHTERKVGDVRIPNYVYDIWMPLLGADAIGVYGVYILGTELLRDLPDTRYHLEPPLVLTVYRAPDYYWVAPDSFTLHGTGATRAEAVNDYARALCAYYLDLRRDRETLAPHLAEHLEFLNSIFTLTYTYRLPNRLYRV